MNCFLGIDAGTSGIKAVIIDEQGRTVGTGYHECDIITPRPGWVEQDPRDWWTACSAAVRQAAAQNDCGKDVKSISFSGQMQGCTLLDKDMNPIRPALLWIDQRSIEEVGDIEQLVSHQEMLDMTANYCLNSFWAPKILWVRKNEPENYAKIHKVLFTKDYLRYIMTGVAATEVSDASLSFLLDVANRQWSWGMIDKLDIPRDIVPEILAESQDIVGHLRADIAEELGLPAGIPVAAGGGDQPVSGVGTGIIRPGIIGSALGTSGVVFGCTEKPLIDTKKRALYTMAHSVPDKWCFLGLILTAAGAFKWLRDTCFAEKHAEFSKSGMNIYDYMTSLASQYKPGTEGLLFLPYLNGEKTPVSDVNARGVFFGLSFRHDIGALCRSVMEGVTFAMRDTIEICREFGGDVSEVRATGGGAKSPLWRQMQADIYNARILTMNVEEGPAAGAAILGAVGSGCFASIEEACDAMIKVESYTDPIKENVKIYDEYYHMYHKLYENNKDLFAENAKIVNKYL